MFKKSEETVYDERQIKERGKIFKLAFFILVVYESLISIFQIKLPFFNSSQLNFIGVMLSVCICSILMILKNSDVSPKNSNWSNIGIGIMSVCSLIGIVCNLIDFEAFGVITSLLVLLICFTYWTKVFTENKSSKNED